MLAMIQVVRYQGAIVVCDHFAIVIVLVSHVVNVFKLAESAVVAVAVDGFD